jgi:hypothetical protein
MRSHVLCLVSRQEQNNYRGWYRYSGTCSEIYMASRIYPDWENESTFVRFLVVTRVTNWGFKSYGMWYCVIGWIVYGVSKTVVPSSTGSRLWPFILSQHDPSQCRRTLTPHHSVTSLFITNPVNPDGRHTACSSRNLHTLEQKVPPTSLHQIKLLKWPALTLS